MDRTERNQKLQTIKHLYVSEGLSLRDIGKRFGLSRQRIWQFLQELGVEGRKTIKGQPLRVIIDPDELRRLYVDEVLSIDQTAKALGTSWVVIDRALDRYDVPRRPKLWHRRKAHAMDGLKIGESATVSLPVRPKAYGNIYSMAKTRKIKISINRIDAESIRITRVK